MIKTNFNFKKAQASIEYMSIFGIGLVLIAIVGGIFYSYTSSAKENLNVEQINNIGKEILDNAEKIYFFGNGNRLTLNQNFPQGVQDMQIYHVNESGLDYYYLNISIMANGIIQSNIFQTNEDYIPLKCLNCQENVINLNLNITQYNKTLLGQGFKNIKIEAINDSVYIDFVE